MNYYEALKIGRITVYDNEDNEYCIFGMSDRNRILQRVEGVGITAIDYTEAEFNAMIEELFEENYRLKIIIRKNIHRY